MTIFGDRTTVAQRRTKSRCDLCGDPILPGDRVRRYAVKDGADFAGLREHETCTRVAMEWWGHDDWPCSRWPFREDDDMLAEARADLSRAREEQPA